MCMSNEQLDKKIDFLAKKAAENYSLSFNEESWGKMELLLNNKDKRKKPVLLWWFIPIVLATTGLGIWYYQHNSNNNIISENKISTTTQKQVTNIHQQQNNNTNNKNLTAVNKENIEKLNSTQPSLKTKSEVSKNNNSTTQNITTTTNKIIRQNNISSKLNNKYTIAKKSNNDSYNSIVLHENNNNINKRITNNTEDIIYKRFFAENIFASNHLYNIFSLKTLDYNNTKTVTQNVTTTKVPSIQKKSLLGKLDIGLLLGTDASFVNTKKINQLSNDAGILITYSINKKLSISSGLLVSKKIYLADSNSYQTPVFPNNRYSITSIAANCLVYDVPVNFNYVLKTNTKSTWLGSAGLSSYFMKKEVYDYDYLYYGQSKKITYEVNNENNHLFSVANIALVYRKKISKQFSYQIMPFGKIPLQGVGRGKVNLYTIGLDISIHYHP